MHNRTKLRKARKVLIEKLKSRMDPIAANGMIRLFDLAGELALLPKEYPPGTYQARFENGLEILYTNKARFYDKNRNCNSGKHDGMNPYMQQVMNDWRKLTNSQENIDAFCEGSDLAPYAAIMNASSIAFNGMLRANWSMVPERERSYGPLKSFSEMHDRFIRMAITTPEYNLLITKKNMVRPKAKKVFSKPVIFGQRDNTIDVYDVAVA